jgi:hypothetical protein
MKDLHEHLVNSMYVPLNIVEKNTRTSLNISYNFTFNANI